MRLELGSLQNLVNDLTKIDQEYVKRFSRVGGLDNKKLIDLVANPINQDACYPEHASKTDIVDYDNLTHQHNTIGEKAVKDGEVAFVVLAGGSGTRFGGPKALAKLPELGISLVLNKIMQSYAPSGDGELKIPTWLMVQPDLVKQLSDHLNCLSPEPQCTVFEQFESYRLKLDNGIDFVSPGVPNMHPCGHGDVGPALIESGLLVDNPTIKYVIVVNVDNVLATPVMTFLGQHISSGHDVTCEVVERTENDVGGCLVWLDGKLQIVEDFRLPLNFSRDAMYHNTNTMIISTSAFFRQIEWKWHRVRKHIDNKIVVQYERLLQQYTSDFNTQYILVRRDRRYLPIKTETDLLKADLILNGNKRR